MGLRDRKRGGFSLSEILIAIGILAIVAVLAVPQVQRANLRSKIETENVNIRLLQGAKEAYVADHPGLALSNPSALLLYLPDQQLPKSPFGTEYQNLTDLSKPVISGSVEVPDSTNNFVSLAKLESSGFIPLPSSGSGSGVVAMPAPSPTPTLVPTTPPPIVNNNPSVILSVNPSPAFRGQTVTLTAVGSDVDGDILSYNFRVSGESVYGGANSTLGLSFPSLGEQPIDVVVSDGKGGSALADHQLSVVNRTPSVTISSNPTSGVRGQSFTFTATGTDLDGDVLTYSFNNGAYSSSKTFTISYTTLGTQSVSVKARDAFGAISAESSISVNIVNRAPTVTVSANPISGPLGQSFTFTAVGSDLDGDALQYSFNGGAYGTSSTLRTSYASAGTWTTSVVVKDALGATSAPASVSVTTRDCITCTGTLYIRAGEKIRLNNVNCPGLTIIVQSQGILYLTGTNTFKGVTINSGGRLFAAGTLISNVTNNGQFSPGHPPNSGTYTLKSLCP